MKSLFFDKNSKIDKTLYIIAKRQRENIPIDIRDVKGIKTSTDKNQRYLKTYFKNPYSTKLKNLKERDDFLDTYSRSQKLDQDQMSNLKKSIETEVQISTKALDIRLCHCLSSYFTILRMKKHFPIF